LQDLPNPAYRAVFRVSERNFRDRCNMDWLALATAVGYGASVLNAEEVVDATYAIRQLVE